MAIGLTQLLTELSIKNLPAGKALPACKLTISPPLSKPIVQKMWDPRSLTTLRTSTACYRNSFVFYSAFKHPYNSKPVAFHNHGYENQKLNVLYMCNEVDYSVVLIASSLQTCHYTLCAAKVKVTSLDVRGC
jgi:hypothetical protein